MEELLKEQHAFDGLMPVNLRRDMCDLHIMLVLNAPHHTAVDTDEQRRDFFIL